MVSETASTQRRAKSLSFLAGLLTPGPGGHADHVQGEQHTAAETWTPVNPQIQQGQRQLTWKFFGSSRQGYQLDLNFQKCRGIPEDEKAAQEVQCSINGQHVLSTTVPAPLHGKSYLVIQVPLSFPFPELRGCTFDIAVSEQAKDKLAGSAKAARQQLGAPEFAGGLKNELMRQLAWHAMFQGTSYYITLTFTRKYSLVRLAVNGFIVLESRPSFFNQVSMRKAKYTAVVEEGGLGNIGGSSITVQAWRSQSGLQGKAYINNTPLDQPTYFKGAASSIMPLMMSASSSNASAKQTASSVIEALSLPPLVRKGVTPKGWIAPTVLQRQALPASKMPANASGRKPQMQTGRSLPLILAATPALALAEDRASVMPRQASAGHMQISQMSSPARDRPAGALPSSPPRRPASVSGDRARSSEEGAGNKIQIMPAGRARRGCSCVRPRPPPSTILRTQPPNAILRTSSIDWTGYEQHPDLQQRWQELGVRPIFGDETDLESDYDDEDLLKDHLMTTFQSEVGDAPHMQQRRIYSTWGTFQAPDCQSAPLLPPHNRGVGNSPSATRLRSPSFESNDFDYQAPPAAVQSLATIRPAVQSGAQRLVTGSAPISSCSSDTCDSSQSLEDMLRDPGTRAWGLSIGDLTICKTRSGRKRRLGVGSSSIVYRALMHGCEEVALKVIPTHGSTQQQEAQHQAEMERLRMLRHKHIVTYYGAAVTRTCFYIVAEIMAGGDLFTALRRDPAVFCWERLGQRVALDIALGLNCLHCRRPQIVHGDLKSPNILLTKHGVAKIGNIGKLHAQAAASAQMQWSPMWAAPEVFRLERASAQVDVWSYGILIWEMVTQQNIASFAPLGLAVQAKEAQQGQSFIEMPTDAPLVAARIFHACTQGNETHARIEIDQSAPALCDLQAAAGAHRRQVSRKQRRVLAAARSTDGGNLDNQGLADTQKFRLGVEDRTYQVLSADYGFRSGMDRRHSERDGEIPASLFQLGWANFQKEYRSLRKSFRYDEYDSIYKKTSSRGPFAQVLALPGTAFIKLMVVGDVLLQRIGVLSELDDDSKPDAVQHNSKQQDLQARDIRKRLGELELDIDAIWAREKKREQDPDGAIHKAPWFVKGIYYALCSLLDAIYRDRPIERFWLNETVARMPYFGYISMLHLYESLGWWRAGFELRKLHYAEEANELNHLMIMEALGGDRLWLDRFFAQHCAVFYYWAVILLFVFSPSLAYVFSELVEGHAVDTYGQFLDQNEEALKQLPPPAVALEYYKAKDMYLFDALHLDGGLVNPRRPSCNNLYEVFRNIRDDEQEHVDVMTACRDSTMADSLADRKQAEGAQGSFVGPHASIDTEQLV
ncbi:hypothetical protein WJX73_006746 [Symbiochloris irregularis]|uniref:Ubiquinol oxidase n=1 Tax=Symbiochloris irregularis TaxID=706552 RepID=A0AAW1P998_9CHLO